MRNHWRRSGLLIATLIIGVVAWPTCEPAEALGPVSLGTMQGWTSLLDHARNLGLSTADSADVLVQLRGDHAGKTLQGWADGRDLSVTVLGDGRTAVLSGTPERLGNALGEQIDDYELGGLGRFYAARTVPNVPTPLRSSVASIGPISSIGKVHPEGFPILGLGPGGFVDAYDARPLWNADDLGQGQTIVFFEVDGYSQSDLENYAEQFGLPSFPNPLPHIGALGLRPEGETDMDLEVAHAIAPDAKLVYVNITSFGGENASPAAQFAEAFSAAAQQYPGAIWSVSLGQCEDVFSRADARAVNEEVSNAEQHGTSVFVASGDSGGLECLGISQDDPSIPPQGISFPADLPAVTSVGGTTLDPASSGAYGTETTWTEPLLSQGSTGGPSTIFAMPTWQHGPGVISSYSSGSTCGAPPGAFCREVPDVAADANPTTGAAVRFQGRWLASGGTSLATPEWAAFTALIDHYLASRGKRPLGFANPVLYQLASGSYPYAPFHEITLGANDFFPASAGYNMVTGLGTPDVWNIARDLAMLARPR